MVELVEELVVALGVPAVVPEVLRVLGVLKPIVVKYSLLRLTVGLRCEFLPW